MIKISVIIVTLNCKQYIQKCLDSIISLKSKANIELIVVDGVSTDGTIDILERNTSIDKLVIEKDKGIYDAMNKGIQRVSGDYFIFIGADDEMLELPIKQLEIAHKENYMLVAGAVQLNDYIFKSFYSWRIHISNTVHHQSLFYSNSLKVKFNTEYRVFADFDLNQRYYKDGVKIKFIDNVISKYNEDGISSSGKYDMEFINIVRRNFGFNWSVLAKAYQKYQTYKFRR